MVLGKEASPFGWWDWRIELQNGCKNEKVTRVRGWRGVSIDVLMLKLMLVAEDDLVLLIHQSEW